MERQMADGDNPTTGAATAPESDPGTSATPAGQSNGTPDGAKPTGEGEGAKPDTPLSDEGKAALDKEREARRDAERKAAQYRDRLAELEDAGKSEVERAQSQLQRATADLEKATARISELESEAQARELEALKVQIAAEADLPASVAKRLQGKDARELRADAKALRDELQSGTPVGSLGIGRGGTASGSQHGVSMNQLIREASGRG
jgi:hypothetical protein